MKVAYLNFVHAGLYEILSHVENLRVRTREAVVF